VNESDSWWEKQVLRFFMKRGPLTAAVVPVVLGLAVLYGTAVVATLVFEHRFWTRSIETSIIVMGGALGLVVTYLITLLATIALSTRGRTNRLLALHQTMREIREMSWTEFEQLVGANYEALGYDVEHVGRAGPDGGRDLVMRKDGETVLVQCKHYRDSWVHEVPLRQFLGVVESHRAARGIFVSCGVFDESAESFAKRNPRIQLVGGEQLRDMVQSAATRQLGEKTYSCPNCGAPMRPKTGKYGAFLSCSNYPACKGSQDWPTVEVERHARA